MISKSNTYKKVFQIQTKPFRLGVDSAMTMPSTIMLCKTVNYSNSIISG